MAEGGEGAGEKDTDVIPAKVKNTQKHFYNDPNPLDRLCLVPPPHRATAKMKC